MRLVYFVTSAVAAFGGDTEPAAAARVTFGKVDRAHPELAARLFVTAQKELFVYAKLDLDADIARALGSVDHERFSKKSRFELFASVAPHL